MPSLSRTALALAAAALAGCASRGGARSADGWDPDRPEGMDLDVAPPGWASHTFQPGSPGASTSRALRPDEPWMGTIGLKGIRWDDVEFGGGVFVPNYGDGRSDLALSLDRVREMGVGVWAKIDF